MPEKDPIQETVSAFKSDKSLKTTIGEDAELSLPIWHCGTCKVFLMHVSTVIDAIKKRGTFKAYKEACEADVEQRKASKQAMAALAILNAAVSEGEKTSKKASENATQKAKEGVALADAPDPEVQVEYQADVGTLEGGYVRNVPLPRILLRQSTSPVVCAATLTESTDTYYSKVPWIPTWSEITTSLKGLGKTAIMLFFLVG
jgi:hypothetical protein